jgi:hypothetical protein
MYDNDKCIAFASAVKIDALSGNLILDVKLHATSMLICFCVNIDIYKLCKLFTNVSILSF